MQVNTIVGGQGYNSDEDMPDILIPDSDEDDDYDEESEDENLEN